MPAFQPPDRPTILLTGFGPFPSIGANATTVLIPHLAAAARRAFPGLRFSVHILPTEWIASLRLLADLTEELQPVVALHFGVSGRATGFEIETRGRNACSPSEDAAGELPIRECVTPGGPEYLRATIPAPHIVSRLRRQGIPARTSRDAGGYLCNALLYRSLEIARASNRGQRTGFVHLPATLVHERRPEREPWGHRQLAWDDVISGGLEVIRASIGQPPAPSGRVSATTGA